MARRERLRSLCRHTGSLTTLTRSSESRIPLLQHQHTGAHAHSSGLHIHLIKTNHLGSILSYPVRIPTRSSTHRFFKTSNVSQPVVQSCQGRQLARESVRVCEEAVADAGWIRTAVHLRSVVYARTGAHCSKWVFMMNGSEPDETLSLSSSLT